MPTVTPHAAIRQAVSTHPAASSVPARQRRDSHGNASAPNR